MAERSKTRESLQEQLDVVARDIQIFNTINSAKPRDRPFGGNGNATSEDFCEFCNVEDIEELSRKNKTEICILISALRFMGAEGARGNKNSGEDTLRANLAKLLFPEMLPERERSLSPQSRRRQLGAMILRKAQEEQAEEARRRMESPPDRPAKRARLLECDDSAIERIKQKLGPEDFDKLFIVRKTVQTFKEEATEDDDGDYDNDDDDNEMECEQDTANNQDNEEENNDDEVM